MKTFPPMLLLLAIALPLGGCSDSRDDDPSESRVLRLGSASDDCENPVSICRETFPPQCDTYCADAPPPDCDRAGACDDCVVSIDDRGQELIACPGDDCSIGYDPDTGVETIECPPGTGGGSVPGCSGDQNNDGICDDDQ